MSVGISNEVSVPWQFRLIPLRLHNIVKNFICFKLVNVGVARISRVTILN